MDIKAILSQPSSTAFVLTIIFWHFITFAPSMVDAACPPECFGCDTTSVSCYLRSPLRGMDLLPAVVQDVTVTCLPGGRIDKDSLEPISRLHNLLDLKISGCFQGTLQRDTFSKLSTLRLLNISNNNIMGLSEDSLNHLSNLDTLDISNNSISILPPGFFSNFPKLERLYLDDNKLNKLPTTDLSKLLLLQFISLSNNQFSSVSGLFSNIKKLTRIDLSHNELTSLAYGDLEVPNLKYLDLGHNKIKTLDKKAFEKSALVTLIMPNNLITTADPTTFPYVTSLDLSNNRIQTLSASFSQFLGTMRDVDLSGNPFHCNCDLEHLRTFYTMNRSLMGSIKCRTPMAIDFKDAKTPFNCMAPAVSLSRIKDGILCEVRGDPSPSVDWLDFKSGQILVTSPPPKDASITSHAVQISQDMFQSHSEVMCRSQNRHDSASEKCYVFDFTKNLTTASSAGQSEEGTFKKSVFIGSLVGVFIGTLCLVTYIVICVKYGKCRCKKDEDKDIKQLSKHRQYYAQPKIPRRRMHKMTPRPWEFPPHFPNPFGPRSRPQRPTAEDNIYATINENHHNAFNHQHFQQQPHYNSNNTGTTVTIEELPASDDEDVKPPMQDSPDLGGGPSLRIMELPEAEDTPDTSATTLRSMSNPAQSNDPLPLTNIDPDPVIKPDIMRNKSRSPHSSRVSLSSSAADLPYIFAANRRMSDRLGIKSMSGLKRPSVMVLGDVTGIPGFSGFDGVQMERTPSMDFGYELEV